MIDGDAMFAHLASRRSVREFSNAPVDRALLERLIAAAATAPSATNRQPWRFTIVTAPAVRARIVDAVRTATEAIERIIRTSAHAEEWGLYGDFFWQPLAAAPAIVVPAVKEGSDGVAGYLRSAGADVERFQLPGAMRPERCAVGGAVMALQLQAHAEGLGSTWMAGPMVARREVEAICNIKPPWQMLGAIAVGHRAAAPAPTPRKALEDVTRWIEEDV